MTTHGRRLLNKAMAPALGYSYGGHLAAVNVDPLEKIADKLVAGTWEQQQKTAVETAAFIGMIQDMLPCPNIADDPSQHRFDPSVTEATVESAIGMVERSNLSPFHRHELAKAIRQMRDNTTFEPVPLIPASWSSDLAIEMPRTTEAVQRQSDLPIDTELSIGYFLKNNGVE